MPRHEVDGPIHQRRSLENLELFLETLATTGMVTKAAARIGISTNTAHKWRNLSKANPKDPRFLLVDPMGEWMMRMPADPDPARLRRDLDRLLRASASWDSPGR